MSERDERDPVVAEFLSYRQRVRDAFLPAPAEVVFATAHGRLVRRRAAVVTTAAVAVLAVLVTGAAVARTSATSQPVPPASQPASAEPAVPTPEPTTAPPSGSPESTDERAEPPADWSDPGNDVRFLDEPTAQRLRNAALTLPAWPGYEDTCPAGEYDFVDGEAVLEEGTGGGPGVSYGIGGSGIIANVDGAPGDEIVVTISCPPSDPPMSNLLALAPDGTGFRALGYVMVEGADEIGGPDRFFPDGDEIVVEVQGPAGFPQLEQRRRYRWDGSRFEQVGGPTDFPDFAEVSDTIDSFRVGSSEIEPCGSWAILSFEDDTSGAWPFFAGDVTIPAVEFLRGVVSEGTVSTQDGDSATTLVTVTCHRPDDGHTETWVQAIGSGVVVWTDDAVTEIVSHRIVDGLAEVTVRTAGGEETRRYRNTDGYTWEQVS
jgi:hypothetical protein